MDTITNIPVSSLTYALKGQKVLERYGYKAWAGRDHNRVSGCGYQLTVRGDPEKAKELLVQCLRITENIHLSAGAVM